MSKKFNGISKWIGIILAFLIIAFNSGVTYNHIHNLTKAVEKLTVASEKMHESIDEINLKLVERSNQ